MLLDILKQFNWVDIVVIILLLRIGYIAFKNGLLIELFKLLGTTLAIYLALHYYTTFSDWINQRLPILREKVPFEFLDFLSFLALAILGYLIFVLLRSMFYRVINKIEAVPQLNHWGGLVLGLARGILFNSLIIFMLVISSIDYFKNNATDSYLDHRLFKIAPATYSWLWNSFMSKFMPNERFNKTILEIQEDLGVFKKPETSPDAL
jgi:uncharacterized membrane protein required for colicin V production